MNFGTTIKIPQLDCFQTKVYSRFENNFPQTPSVGADHTGNFIARILKLIPTQPRVASRDILPVLLMHSAVLLTISRLTSYC